MAEFKPTARQFRRAQQTLMEVRAGKLPGVKIGKGAYNPSLAHVLLDEMLCGPQHNMMAVRKHGSIRDTPFTRAWWGRAALRIAQHSHSLAVSLASKLKGYWQGQTRDEREDRARERSPDEGGYER